MLIVANPNSGGGLAGELVPYLVRDLGQQGYPVEVFQSAAPGQITARVREATAPLHAICIVGGDGTVREVLGAEPSDTVPIAVLPAGTANVLSADFRLPKAPAETAAMIIKGRTRLVDSGTVTRVGHAPEPFLLMVGAGIDSRIIERVHAKRSGGTFGKLRYLGPAFSSLVGYRPLPHFFVLEDGTRHGPFEQVIVTNVRSYGGLWKLPGDITPDDGLFDCVGFCAKSRTALLKHGFLGTINRLREGPDLFHMQASRVRLEVEGDAPSPIQVDGDPGGVCPVEIIVRPRALRLVVPER